MYTKYQAAGPGRALPDRAGPAGPAAAWYFVYNLYIVVYILICFYINYSKLLKAKNRTKRPWGHVRYAAPSHARAALRVYGDMSGTLRLHM